MDLKGGVFLDRDGTIVEEKGYLNDPEGVKLIIGAARGIRLFNHLGMRTVVVSNQSGVARGYFPVSVVDEINKRVQLLLEEGGASLDGMYYCPHHPDDGCTCRKPEPGMLQLAAEELGIDLPSSYMVGDKADDIGAVHRVSPRIFSRPATGSYYRKE
jgi:D-glycero-D-manno-heptose 1,7-bisphosphate phosphatase